MSFFPATRLRRLRYNPGIRDLVRENHIQLDHLIYPLFVTHGKKIKKEISAMPGCFQFSKDMLLLELKEVVALGVNAVLLFGLPEHKDDLGSGAWNKEEVIPQAVAAIKKEFPELVVMTDLCFCEYTTHGHCGVVDNLLGHPDVNNDATLPLLAKQAVVHAEAGVDVVAPSGMMDGMIDSIRKGLDAAGFSHLPIMSYSAKYASSLYSPFRTAVDSMPSQGNRKSYQMDPANSAQAFSETALDIAEGADIVMVKPALFYLDIIAKMKMSFPHVPLAAYCVGGEYAMIKAAAKAGWINERDVVLEQTLAVKRAGADLIITYSARQIAAWLKSI
ncbi:porphobilinogen synthase [Legionella taurinensis]|uniref:Delta-aminolevulinic acid dehydratase n=1 Tax=Legionella taurinensis TaxID=70611 RepID=A0A3A5L3M9_9GAMM|nr:porphobilinogen synthase [Legionella taurinensis]MDX1838720.1 porphobilinogen synthase [Legionella taurinensis]PUT38780.1 porphobilinogen synthase [Legionella taurinensis]PUT40222.1 porphobilinogen synthase [Legionella taurinensis]PUT42529.1 porphobilinogen synthase [Legionella taurinensis]PUT45948.1 porphobilinogen synthase [Legionella taurinensis]